MPKITTKGGAFALRENVASFCAAATRYGVETSELFQTVDLFEKKKHTTSNTFNSCIG